MKKKSFIITILIYIVWVIYTLVFVKISTGFSGLYTNGANLDIQIIQILNHEAINVLLLVMGYFLLLGVTLLYLIYAFLIKYKNKKYFMLSLILPVIASIYYFTSIIGAILAIVCIITVGIIFAVYTVAKNEDYNEDGDIIYIQKDILSEDDADKIAREYIKKHASDFSDSGFNLEYEIISTSENKYDINVYITEDITSGGHL